MSIIHYITEEQHQLMNFYNVKTLEELVSAQHKHIERLQEKLEEKPNVKIIHSGVKP